MSGAEYRPIKLWVCDHCAEFAEDEPGATCETCCEGTIRAVEYVPAEPRTTAASGSQGRVE